MDSPSSPAVDAPKKRVMPSRSRRGGPGVGNCDSDVLILDTYKRQYEIEPLIPLDTPFLLSTNSEAAINTASNSEAGIHINIVANERYFARPEVLKAFREQEIIQTPEFESIGESSYVGTRTRPRPEDATIDTSDAAYEKRHRKFETLEKRQRLREKEKLKHEHYKLKERIEQLKAMDGAAFMTLPASSFSPAPPQATAELNELVTTGSPYAQINGVISNSEGERRRKEMLETATKLEKRYAYLLPPDRVRKTQDQPSDSSSKIPLESRDEEESESERISYHAGTSRRDESMKFRIPARSSASATPAPSPAASKPAINKKPRASGASKQLTSSRLRRGSISTTPSTALPPEHETPTSNDYNDVEMHDSDHVHASTPGPSGPFDDDALLQTPLSNINVTFKTTIPDGNGRLKNGKGHGVETSRAAISSTVPSKPLVEHGDNDTQMAEDGESEKVSSEDEALEEPVPEPEPEPVVVPTKAKRGRKKKVKEPVVMVDKSEALGDSEEVKDLSSRLKQATVKEAYSAEGPQNDRQTTEDMSIPPSLPFEQVESISKRPYKRRKQTAQTTASSIRTPSAQPAETPSGRKYASRNKPHTTYITTSGEKETTSSLLIMAAVRKGARIGEIRHTTSFGTETPKFKDTYEFELPEWLHFPDSEPGSPRLAMPDVPIQEPTQFILENDTKSIQHEEQINGGHDMPLDQAGTEADATAASETGEPGITEGESEQTSEDMHIDETEAIDEDKTETTDQKKDSIQEDEYKQASPEPEIEDGHESPEDDAAITPAADDTESEARIRPRILSRPAEDEDELLEW